MPDTAPPPTTRERLIAAMTDALQRRGLHGIGLAELLESAQAPKGVLYHHFPGGKTELAVAAIDAAVAGQLARIEALLQRGPTPLDALRTWMAGAQRQLERSRFDAGCPLATVALESTADDAALRQALARGFASLRERLAGVLQQAGLTAPRAAALAPLIVAAYEGALMQSRVAADATPLTQTAELLLELVAREQHEAGALPQPAATPAAHATERPR